MFEDVRSEQEDWGWFIWFRCGPVHLALDVYCDDPRQGAFRVHLTSRRKRWLVLDSIVDTPELGSAKDCILERLEGWSDTRCRVTRLDENYVPASGAV
jgi:hypothetical protein